jgi:ABC-type cobalamin/Fe3+-siderophores transport system ATPase subunit
VEFVGIVGPNGSGKTSLLKLLGKVLHPQAGSIRLHA